MHLKLLIEQILSNCALHSHDVVRDERGCLVALEAEREVPFAIERVYYLYGTAPGAARGFHAHKTLEQWAVCVAGQCRIIVDDGSDRVDVLLDSPDKGLHIGRGVWREMHDFSPGAVLMVIASARYDEGDYIRSYDDFIETVRAS